MSTEKLTNHAEGNSFIAKELSLKTKIDATAFNFHNPKEVKNPRPEPFMSYIEFLGASQATNKTKAYNHLKSIGVRVIKPSKIQAKPHGFKGDILYVDLSTIKPEDMESHTSVKLNPGEAKAKTKAVGLPGIVAKNLRNLLKDEGIYVNSLPSNVSKEKTSCVFVEVKTSRMYMNHGTEATKKALYNQLLSVLRKKNVLIDGNGKSITLLEDPKSPLLEIVRTEQPGKAPKAKAAARETTGKGSSKEKTKKKNSGFNLSVFITDDQIMDLIKNMDFAKIQKAFPDKFKTGGDNQIIEYVSENFVLIRKDSPVLSGLNPKIIKTLRQLKKELSKATP